MKLIFLLVLVFSSSAFGHSDYLLMDGGVPKGTGFVINTFVMLFSAALIMWMAAGFCMLETGLVRRKNTAVICLKNILIYSIACICFYLIGYNLMFKEGFSLLANMDGAEFALLKGVDQHLETVLKNDYSTISIVLFQTTFVATTASIISGTVAERVKLWPFFVFVAILATIIYPLQGAWSWGGGWLAKMGFVDFAGSTVVHSVGGWAALTGAYFLGPRRDKYGPNGEVKTYFPSSVPSVGLGVFILWLGWLGFNGGSLLTTASVPNMSKMALIFMNTNIAACSGAVVALFLGRWCFGRINILLVLNGALAGLVSITAGPDLAGPLHAIIVGGIGSILATLTIPLLDKLKIDDVVGAIPVHLVAGIWGTLAVGIWGHAPILSQISGILAIGAFVSLASAILWLILKKTMGIRVSEDSEHLGQDLLELGIEEDDNLSIE